MSYIIDTASPAPGPLLKGKAGSGVGREADGSTGSLVLMLCNPPGLRGALVVTAWIFKVPAFNFGFIAAYFIPLVLCYLITTEGGNPRIRD